MEHLRLIRIDDEELRNLVGHLIEKEGRLKKPFQPSMLTFELLNNGDLIATYQENESN